MAKPTARRPGTTENSCSVCMAGVKANPNRSICCKGGRSFKTRRPRRCEGSHGKIASVWRDAAYLAQVYGVCGVEQSRQCRCWRGCSVHGPLVLRSLWLVLRYTTQKRPFVASHYVPYVMLVFRRFFGHVGTILILPRAVCLVVMGRLVVTVPVVHYYCCTPIGSEGIQVFPRNFVVDSLSSTANRLRRNWQPVALLSNDPCVHRNALWPVYHR